jgi:hypothetical protein
MISFFQRHIPWYKKYGYKKIPTHSVQVGYSEEFGCVLVLESSWFGYRPTEWKRWLKTHNIVHAHSCKDGDLDLGIKWAGGRFGAKYDYKGLFAFIWKLIKYKLGLRWTKHSYTSTDEMYCSEAATRVIKQSGYWLDVHADSVSPLEFMCRLFLDDSFVDVTQQVKTGTWWQEFEEPSGKEKSDA